MTLLLDDASLRARRGAVGAGGGLAPLADALARELEPLVDREPWVPPEKARMTRYGGRCTIDGTLLEFDPWSPRLHRCARCGATYDGEEHYRWWIYGYQLWLAERAVHAAVLHALRGDDRHAALADSILARYTEQYLRYPNADNVLGPTRVFFSTYLESIWLLQLCVAADLRRHAGAESVVQPFIDRVVEPSVAVLGAYDEGLSNRQTWNAAALLAAARLRGDDIAAARHALGGSGVAGHLMRGLLPDGSWYEGENYHLFAHRALWYGVTLAERAGLELPPEGRRRFDEGFAVPFLTALPDFTFPARRDSQHQVSLRQWRFAELCELGLARTGDARLGAALRTLYDDRVPEGETGRARSTGEAERNAPAARLGRADLGWKSLLCARAQLPDASTWSPPPASVLMEGQGFAVLRRDAGRVYVSLDYGHSGGGHGHPDRLNLMLHDGPVRWLDDVGTGSYTDPSLHWYRSTLAHNAPMLDGQSQQRADGRLVAWEDRGGAGWVEAEFLEPWAAALLIRTVVVMPDYLVDVVSWRGAAGMIDLPVHVQGELHHVEAWHTGEVSGGADATDGFPFVSESEVTYPAADEPVRLEAELGGARATAWFLPSAPAEFWRLVAPGPPYEASRAMFLVRVAGEGDRGALASVWSWRGAVAAAYVEGDDVIVQLDHDTRHAHRRTAEGWHIDLLAGGARSSIDLGGLRGQRSATPQEPLETVSTLGSEPGTAASVLALEPLPEPELEGPLRMMPGALVDDPDVACWIASLGEGDWRRTEDDWRAAGGPTADVAVALVGEQLVLEVHVRAREPYFAPATAHNPLDNEHPDVNSSGIQLYFGQHQPTDPALPPPAPDAAWLLVPEAAPRVRVTPRGGDDDMLPDLDAIWAPAPDGYIMRVSVAREWVADANLLGLHLVVNEMPRGRERRRGQLVLGGARGEWGYLRGDREDGGRLVYFDTSDA